MRARCQPDYAVHDGRETASAAAADKAWEFLLADARRQASNLDQRTGGVRSDSKGPHNAGL